MIRYRIRRDAERRRRDDEIRRRQEEEQQRRHEYELKRQREIDELELRMKEEEKRRIKEELASITNGNGKEVEMEIESPTRVDDLSEHYPPPPSDALLPLKGAPPRYSVAGSKEEGKYSGYSPSAQRPDEPIRGPPPTTYPPYDRGRSPPPLPNISRDRPPPIPPHAIPGLPPPPSMVSPSHPRLPPTTIPPPPLPPAISVIRMPPRHDVLPGDPFHPPTIPPPGKPPIPVVPIVVPPTLPPPVILPPPTTAPLTDNGQQRNPSIYCRLANAPYSVTEGEVRDFFRKTGVVPEAVEFLSKDGKRSGHIFVKFSNENDAVEATKLDQKPLLGRDTLVRLAYISNMQQALRRFDTRDFDELFKQKLPPGPPKDSLNLERDIYRERMTCVRIANLPTSTIRDDILRAFPGVGIIPNGIHILKSIDGKCNGSAFVEVITPEDCLRAANLHGVGTVHGSLIRVMPLKQQDMDREIHNHHEMAYGRGPPPIPPAALHHPPIRGHLPVPPPLPPPHGMHHPPPPIRPDHDMRLEHRPPMTRSPPHHMSHRPNSPSRGPLPPRPRSPPRGPPTRPITPPLGSRSPREMSREEIAHRALYDIDRRIQQERFKMRDLGPPGPFGDRLPGPRFDRPGGRPYPPPGPPPRLPPPHFVGDGPWRVRHPADAPRFRLPPTSVAVKMGNLSFHVTQEDILEFFIKFLPIPDSVRLMYNPSGRLTGEGYIAFPNREAADRAILELDKKTLLQRPIKLFLA